jgi:hypothetical protein
VRHFCQSHWSSLNDRGARPTRAERASPVRKPHRLQHHRTRSGKGLAPPPRRLSRHSIRSAPYIAQFRCPACFTASAREGRAARHSTKARIVTATWHSALEGRQGHRPAEEPRSIPRAGAAVLVPVDIRSFTSFRVLRPGSARQTEVSGVPGRLISSGHRKSLSRHLHWRPSAPAPTLSVGVTLHVTALKHH